MVQLSPVDSKVFCVHSIHFLLVSAILCFIKKILLSQLLRLLLFRRQSWVPLVLFWLGPIGLVLAGFHWSCSGWVPLVLLWLGPIGLVLAGSHWLLLARRMCVATHWSCSGWVPLVLFWLGHSHTLTHTHAHTRTHTHTHARTHTHTTTGTTVHSRQQQHFSFPKPVYSRSNQTKGRCRCFASLRVFLVVVVLAQALVLLLQFACCSFLLFLLKVCLLLFTD